MSCLRLPLPQFSVHSHLPIPRYGPLDGGGLFTVFP